MQEDIKCEDSKEEPLELLINTEISTLERTLEPEDKERARLEEQENLKDMDFQLNPNAAEFIPVSPQFAEPRMSLVEDYPVSGSPFKQVPQMDDIQVPSQSEFEKEVCQRPREVENDEKEYQNGDNLQRADCADFASERQKATSNLDDSEISSTKAEFGDESTASFLTASEFHRTGITVDESFSSSERDYDIAKDPMAMSYTPSDFEAAFDKGVDLNAVHNLSNTDLDEKNGMEKEDEDLIGECGDFQADSTNAAAHDLVTVEEKVSEVPEESAVLVNLPSHQEECEDTFIAPADEPTEEKTVDLLNLQSEPTQEQQEIARYDHSPLTENYSGEFPESEKEPVSVDNEQPLSPSSVDIDETKPIDEASEDAALPIESDLQKEACINEAADTPSSLSPVPDAMEDDVAAAATVAVTAAAAAPANVSENLNLSTLHADAPEFVPGHYSVQDFEGDEACQLSPAEATDVCQMSPAEPVENAFEPIKEDLVATMERDEKEVDELCAKPAVQENLLNFAEEENVCAKPPQVDDQLTPPLSPQKIEKIVEDVVCPFESSVSREHEDKFGLKETPEETNLLESKTKQIEEAMMEPEQPAEQSVIANEMLSPIKERTMNLSDSMQEFTGLEKQLQPKEDDILAASVVADTIKDIKEEEVKEDVQPEKLVDLVAEEPCKTEEKVEESLPSEPKEIETLETKEPEVNVPEIKPEAKVEEEPKEQVEEPKEKTEIKEENKVSEVAAAVAATAAVAAAGTAAAAAAAVAAQSKAKPKTSSAAKSATKTTAAKTAAPKSNPTSPSKTTAAATRTSTAATKKPSTIAAARPKDLDAPKKATASSTTASKPLTPKSSKTATTTTTVAAAAAKSSTTRMSAASKTKLVASPKPADKKPTANGDVKPLSKPAAAKPAVTKSSATKTSTTTAKAASTTARPAGTTTTITMSKPRPASATTKTTTSMTTKSSSTATSSATTATSTPRPKTAPISGTATKTRLLAKSPIIDKQVKETANKQISMARTTAGASKTTATRSSVASSTTSSSTTARRVSSTTKTTATSQTRKSTTATSKVTKTSTVGKTTAVEKPKIVQNGVSEKVEINAIIDDVPKKDLSPVVAPNDNQLIASSD